MPRGDKTGPQGAGPMTGRRMGDCTDAENTGSGFGFGRRFFSRTQGGGRGFGFGRGYGFFNRNDEDVVQNEITTIKKRLSFLENLLHKNKSDE